MRRQDEDVAKAANRCGRAGTASWSLATLRETVSSSKAAVTAARTGVPRDGAGPIAVRVRLDAIYQWEKRVEARHRPRGGRHQARRVRPPRLQWRRPSRRVRRRSLRGGAYDRRPPFWTPRFAVLQAGHDFGRH